MKIYYNPEAQNMLLEGLNKDIPTTAVEITKETHDAILKRGVNQQVVVRNGKVFIEDIIFTQAELLEQAKEAKTSEISNARELALVAGFEFDGGVYDSDPESMQNINGLVTQTLLQPTFSTNFITKDNEIVQLDATKIKALGEAARAYKEQVIFKARQLKDAVIAAKTVEEVEAIKW